MKKVSVLASLFAAFAFVSCGNATETKVEEMTTPTEEMAAPAEEMAAPAEEMAAPAEEAK